jgi:hypothetical protein
VPNLYAAVDYPREWFSLYFKGIKLVNKMEAVVEQPALTDYETPTNWSSTTTFSPTQPTAFRLI